jgi:L-seryl-tRNA(Ser) seleniumtransferase
VPPAAQVAEEARRRLEATWRGELRRVINATGILIHTNLGRAPLALEAQRAIAQVASGYSSLEMDLSSGRRRSRLARVAGMLARLAGAEDALAVNNNAAAVLLVLRVLARDRPVVISRGEMVEIGGSFRLPEIMEASGVRLLEVGTTNRTRVADYEKALAQAPALILKVHPSNYVISGYTEEAPVRELSRLARGAGIPLVVDLGSGALEQQPEASRRGEPTVQGTLRDGADLVTASGDKLLGGPQAGLVWGRAELVERLRRHPLARAVRLDKILLCALEAHLATLAEGAEGWARIPLQQLVARSPEELEALGRRLAAEIARGLGAHWEVAVVASEAAWGGGSLPGQTLESRALRLRHPQVAAEEVARRLRSGEVPIVGRIEEDELRLDLRTLLDEDIDELPRRVVQALRATEG